MDTGTNSIGLSSPCSCDDCDTLRCFTRTYEMFKDESDDRTSNTCIFFTKITVRNPNSKTDNATSDTAECEFCRRCFNNEQNLDAYGLINVNNTSKYVCESCISNINKIKQPNNNADLVIIDTKPLSAKDSMELEFESCKPKENDTRDIKFESCETDTSAQQRSVRKSKCKICIRDFQTSENVDEKKDTEKIGLEKISMKCKVCKRYLDSQDKADDLLCNICKSNIPGNISTDAENKNVRPSFFELCQNYLQTNINKTAMHIMDTVKSKCKPSTNNTENTVDPNRCKFCKMHVDSHEEIIESVCKSCKAYFPITQQLCQNQLQNNINETSANIKDTVKAKCKRCKNCTESDVGRKKCKLCRRYVDSHQEMTDPICKTCETYFPTNFKDIRSSLFELCPNYLQENSNRTSMNILDAVRKKCKRCKKYIEKDDEQKKCKYCRRFIDSHQEILEPICKICKAYVPTNLYTDTVKSEVSLKEKKGNAKFKSNTCTKALKGCEINAEKIATISSEELQAKKIIKPIKGKVSRPDIEKKDKTNFTTIESKCSKNPKYIVCKRAIEDFENSVGRKTAYDSEFTSIDSNTSLCQDYRRNIINGEIKQRKDRPIFRPTDIKCTGGSKCNVCTMNIKEFQTAVDKMIGIGSDLKKYNLNSTPCTDCRMDSVSSEIIATEKTCTGKSKCKVCRRYVDEWEAIMGNNAATHKKIIPLCEFCQRNLTKKGSSDTVLSNITPTEKICTRNSKCKGCVGDIEEWETAIGTAVSLVNSEIMTPDTIMKVTSLCKLCKKETKDKVKTGKLFTKKSKGKLGRDVEDWQVHFGIIKPNYKPDSISSQCQFCRMSIEKQGKQFGNEIGQTNYVTQGCNNYIKTTNQMDIVNNDFTLKDKNQNSCWPRHYVDLSKETPVSSEKKIKLCDCTKSESEPKVYNVFPLCRDIHPSALKLSAQIMNVPYEEFQESLNQQINHVNKATMKSTLSNDIFKRIKEAYKACSCKVCECIIGKSLTSNNDCNCKPCDCADCKSFKILSHDIQSEPKLSYVSEVLSKEISGAKNNQDQPCGCTPCSCIRCTQIPTRATVTEKSTPLPPVRTYIAARVSENRHADNCTCPACHCAECERNFFSLSTHVTHEMSTGMTRNCRCEQCLDQRCRGAGGTDECRCEMPSKAIFKPVEKDSHDYDIHRAAVCHKRNKRNNGRDAIAMYATVSSNFTQLGTVKEGCSCDECECVSCKGENSKVSIKTILKPALQIQSTKTNTCDCIACECEICNYARNIPDGPSVNYKDAECNCEECDCMNCQIVSKCTTPKLTPLAKPIGKIYYRNNEKECTDMPITECSQPMREKNQYKVSIKTILNKDHCNNKNCNSAQKIKDNRYYCLDSKKSTLNKTCSVSQDLPQQYTAVNKYFENNLNKALNHINYREKGRVVKGNKLSCKYNKVDNSCSSVSTFSGVNQANLDENNDNENEKINLQPWKLTLSNYKANCPKTTLETCLNDILKLDDDFNLKMGSKMNKPNIAYNTATYDYEKNQDIDDIDVYDYMFEPFSSFHRNIYNQNLDGVQICKPSHNGICNKCKIINKSKMCTIPSAVNSKSNFVKNQIDYARVHNTLKEAKHFSEQLIKLLDKYERANRDFQSVSEKLKLLHETNECNKLKDSVHFQLDYVIIEKEKNIHDNNEMVTTIENVNDGSTDINSCKAKYSNNNSNKTQNAIIFVNSDQNDNSQNKIILVEKGRQPEQNAILTTDLVITKDANGQNINSHLNDIKEKLTTTETQIVNIGQRSSESSLIISKNDVIPEVGTVTEPIEDSTIVQSICVNNKVAKVEDRTKNNQIREKGETIRNNLTKDTKLTLPFENNTHNQIDILTEQLSEIIKENVFKQYEELAPSQVNIYDTSFEISENNYVLSKDHRRDDGSQGSINRTNFHLNNLDFYIPPYGLILLRDDANAKTYTTSAQAKLERHSNKKYKIEKLINLKSGSSLPRNKTTQVDKESDTRVDYLMGKNKHQKHSGSTLQSVTESDLDSQSRFTMLSSNRHSAMGKSKCSCELLKVGFLGGRRVSDHTVMVKWSKPKDLRNVQGYELLVDGRPVQTIIDSSRCMAVVTCLPNSDKVLLTMKTILLVGTKSGHEPSVTIVYHPRLKKNKTEQSK